MAAREGPCPNRIFDDIGGGFGMGCIGGSLWYFIKGFFNSPKRERFFGGIQHLKRRGPVLGGNFALWAGMFSSCDCVLVYYRNVEDHINPIVAGCLTGGLLAIRAGIRPALKNAFLGGTILGFIELAQMVMIKMQKKQELDQYNEMINNEVSKEKMRRQGEMDKYREEIERRKGTQDQPKLVQF